jgi:hypothetical protein
MLAEQVAVIGPIANPSPTDPYVVQIGAPLESVYET